MSGEVPVPDVATESVTGRREHNEDAVLAAELPGGRLLLAVADGMGGHAAGEVASALALDALEEGLEDGLSLGDAFARANRRVHSRALSELGKQGMGTTLVALLVDGDGYRIANVGDSRAYLISPDGIRQVSEDHSFVAEAVKAGQSEKEAMGSRWKDALTRSIGTAEEVKVDVFGPFPVQRDSTVLLCSDGLFKTLTDSDIRGIYAMSPAPEGSLDALVSAAYDRGSDDNITAAVAEFGKVPRIRPGDTVPIAWSGAGEPEPAAEAAGAGEPEPDSRGPAPGEGEADEGGSASVEADAEAGPRPDPQPAAGAEDRAPPLETPETPDSAEALAAESRGRGAMALVAVAVVVVLAVVGLLLLL